MWRSLRLAAVATVLTILALAPAPASAHDVLLEASPADGSTLAAGDPQVASFRFNNAIFENAAFIAVLDPAGADVATGDPVVAGDTVTREFTATTAGTYTASYRVTSSDGHPIEGSITFTYEGPTETPDAEDRGEAEVPIDPSADDTTTAADDDSGSSTAVVLAIVAVAVLVVGSAVAVTALRRRRNT